MSAQKPGVNRVYEVKVHDLLGMQVIVLPEEYRLTVETVYLLRDGITVLIIPVNEAGDTLIQDRGRALLTDPERVARWKALTEPHLTERERNMEPDQPPEE